ncbi:haloacid dehalogenase-like hydrolase family protein [Tritrichomonas foetus]|uniref:Haloacid dehalogenase-like hydrolase family protein n=1 Tax=Tritrichomonas foetus TaxID=1144522 RepID=A0A1J4J3R8_9EUKA|nr:haloacid dehalogenase-like hydrolase family protein [Tritrichomonas foetus]|eukprot:OHS94096.1 haloacid dehalogenase-like hydrolase family protein [Tritrichomonas foetus]
MSSSKTILVTWDIDGTLIYGADEAVELHRLAFKQGCEEIFGKPCDIPAKFLQISTNGFMDQQILKLMIKKLGFDPTVDNMTRTIQRMEEIFVQNCNVVPTIPPGVENALEALYKMPNVIIGIASGNWPAIAWHKLSLAKIDRYFKRDNIAELGYFDDRKDALNKARNDAEKLKGQKIDVFIHVGDTPHDQKAASEANFIPVIVETGQNKYDYPEGTIIFSNLENCKDEFMKLFD